MNIDTLNEAINDLSRSLDRSENEFNRMKNQSKTEKFIDVYRKIQAKKENTNKCLAFILSYQSNDSDKFQNALINSIKSTAVLLKKIKYKKVSRSNIEKYLCYLMQKVNLDEKELAGRDFSNLRESFRSYYKNLLKVKKDQSSLLEGMRKKLQTYESKLDELLVESQNKKAIGSFLQFDDDLSPLEKKAHLDTKLRVLAEGLEYSRLGVGTSKESVRFRQNLKNLGERMDSLQQDVMSFKNLKGKKGVASRPTLSQNEKIINNFNIIEEKQFHIERSFNLIKSRVKETVPLKIVKS